MRLHHIARRRDDVAQSAKSALLRLADDRRVLPRLLARLVDPERSDLHQSRDRNLFLAAAGPIRLLTTSSGGRPLLSEAGVRKALVHGWAVVLRRGSKAEYEDDVRRWLEVATAQRVDDLLSVLVEACRTEFAVSAMLSSVAYRWLRDTGGGPDTEARRGTVRRLLHAIDEARTTIAPDDQRTDEGRR